MDFLNILKEGAEYREAVLELYEEAFPEEEKKPVSMMLEMAQQGKTELLAIVEAESFVGLAINLFGKIDVLLDYFAISPECRNGGYGGRAVRALQERFAGKTYIFEIEKQDPEASNAEDRRRRKAFYLRNGLKETGVFANVYDTDFELLTPDGKLTYEKYEAFLYESLGAEVVKRIRPRKLIHV